MKALLRSALAVCLLLFATGVAKADIPPPDDYVEDCTIEKQTAPGLECQSCRAWHGERDACDKTLGTQGFRKMCKSWGASAWSEVWCKGEAKPTPTPPAPMDPKPAEGPAPTNGPESKKTGCEGGGADLFALTGLVAILGRSCRKRS